MDSVGALDMIGEWVGLMSGCVGGVWSVQVGCVYE